MSADMRMCWAAARLLVAAAVIALFPGLFILDRRVDWPLSPVLPGLLILAVAFVIAPPLLVEVMGSAARDRTPHVRHTKMVRTMSTAKVLLAAASAWFVLWISVGL